MMGVKKAGEKVLSDGTVFHRVQVTEPDFVIKDGEIKSDIESRRQAKHRLALEHAKTNSKLSFLCQV